MKPRRIDMCGGASRFPARYFTRSPMAGCLVKYCRLFGSVLHQIANGWLFGEVLQVVWFGPSPDRQWLAVW
jgi:hypothetical protein